MKALWLFFGVVLGITLVASFGLSFQGKLSFVSLPTPNFTSPNALVRVQIGLENLEGSIVAFGDFNSDKYTDIFFLHSNRSSISILLWHHHRYSFLGLENGTIHLSEDGFSIENVVPGDFNNDGKLDLLIECAPSSNKNTSSYYSLNIYLGHLTYVEQHPIWNGTATDQVLVFDWDGDTWLDLFGSTVVVGSDNTTISGGRAIWKNNKHQNNLNFTIIDSIDSVPTGFFSLFSLFSPLFSSLLFS